MSKKILMLLFLMTVLISVSAVSAGNLDDNVDTIVSSADAETIAVTNDVDAMDDSKMDIAGGGDVALASDATSAAAGKNNEIYGAEYKNSSSQLLGASDENNVLENENDGEILKETSATWYVDTNAAAGGNGTSEATAFQNLKDALNDAGNGDTIKIASGTYTGDKNTGLTIEKILSFEKYGNDEAIFDAQQQNRIWNVTATTINIDGLTFKNGKDEYGGALYFYKALSDSSINALFINNHAGPSIWSGGGAIFFNSGISNSIINSTFINNTADSYGGAIRFNGGLDNVRIYGEFINSYARLGGGAISFMSESAILNSLIAAKFMNNSVQTGVSLPGVGLGGALFNMGGDDNKFTISSTFIDNKGSHGGAIFFGNVTGASIENSAFVNNYATEAATAVYWESDYWSLNHNWWGSNNPDWNNLINDGIKPSSYAVLVGSADPTTITQLSESRLNYAFYRNTSNIYIGFQFQDQSSYQQIKGNLIMLQVILKMVNFQQNSVPMSLEIMKLLQELIIKN